VWFLLAAFSWLTATVVQAQSFESTIAPVVKSYPGNVAVAVKHLPSGESVYLNAETPMPTASLIKLPILVAAHDAILSGKLSLETPIELEQDDKVPGSGILTQHFSAGLKLPLRDVLRLMIVYSDNTATNLVVEQLGLPRTAELMLQLGLPNTRLHSKVYRGDTSVDPERSKQYGLGSTTAREMVELLELLDAGKVVSPASCQQMIELLQACEDRTMLVRDLPAGTKVAHKSGAVANSRTDAGLIDSPSGRIAICVLTTDNEDKSWDDDNAAHVLIGRIARAAYDYFNPQSNNGQPPMVLSVGSAGEMVQHLQRTLNRRLTPSHNLSTDGDFGPMTEKAVRAFQRDNQLPETGLVDSATWQAVGTLVTEDDPVADPEVINAQIPNKTPAPALDGPPVVTCKAWAIGEAATGKLLWGGEEFAKVHPASTTKIMTAFLITSLAQQDPSVLSEIVTFSENADATAGSSCDLKAGEQVSVGELLYGLMLPSGNDASVALAEHFGGRVSTGGPDGVDARPADASSTTTTENFLAFVQAMNRKAEQLGLKQTSFANTHGLTDEGHLTSARDLMVLSAAAMQQPEFRLRAQTQRRGCRVSSSAGYQRNVVWENTNRLLAFEGFSGVKTGTTSAAGNCLVACEQRGDQELIVVVLGSPSTESRYADARNLLRWAWPQTSPNPTLPHPPK
jgi:D-alanyl-D-alanine carboxypeptidase (penicillin-binding protein 5/6)